MKIAILGTGHVGGALGKRWAQTGHTVLFGTTNPQGEKVQTLLRACGESASAHTHQEAASNAEVVLLAVPWAATQATLQALGDLQGKPLLDATNPLDEKGQLTLGFDFSGGEQVAQWAQNARVVKIFNSTGAGNMANSDYGAQKPSMFLCGDDPAAKTIAAALAAEAGFEPIDSGGLVVSRSLEALTMLWIQLAYRQGYGPDIAFQLLKRPQK
ncbi:MAG: NADPH-dependent F420 reductase [Chloroflexota bacterium]